MKTKIVFINFSVFYSLFFTFSFVRAESLPPIILSEIQIAGEKSDDEFIELYNLDSDPFDLSGLQLRRKTSGGTESSVKVFEKNSTIPAHGYFLWANSNSIFASPLADAQTSSSALADNNSIALFTKSGADGVLIDSISWGNGALFISSAPIFTNPLKNKSLTRNKETLIWTLSDTPTPTNSQGVTYHIPSPPPPSPTIIYDTDVRLNELLPNPTGDESTGEFIELYNTSDKDVDLSLWTIKDASASGKYVFPDDTKIKSKDFLVVYRSIFKFALNNTDETIFLLDPNNEEKDRVSYTTSKEDVSWNYTASSWRGGTPTPGTTNVLGSLPETNEKVPKKGYHGVAIDFDAQGKSKDHDSLKYTWDFGDGHKSYKETTTHTYEEKGTYTITLKTSSSKEDILETFTIKIESYPHPNVRITSLLPNPTGSDTDHEWVIIENREKKAINLKGFSIATGWKTLANHPIRENFIIGAKQESKLTHDYSLFTLPNQKGKIELRAPDGKTLQKIKYKFEKSIADDAVYQKKKGSSWALTISTPKNILLPVPVKSIEVPVLPVKEITPPTPEENTLEEKIAPIEDQISLDPNRPKPQELLAYGTHIRLSDTIVLTPNSIKKTPLSSETPSDSPSFTEKLVTDINTSLNDFLNGL